MRYILSLGSNIGNKLFYIEKALYFIEIEIGNIIKTSNKYKTEPWGFKSDDYFINMVLEIDTPYKCYEVLEKILNIEEKIGRKRNVSILDYQSRVIDIDIIFNESNVLDSDILKLPHPLLEKRIFVLVPLNEIIPNFVHPLIGKTIRELKEECEDKSEICNM